MAQRLRITYRKFGPTQYVGHLDLMRTWERAIRRARLPLAYSQGFSPHARMALAAPLPVGTLGERELMDIWLAEPVAPGEAAERLAAALPPGLGIVDVEEVGERLPSLQSSTRRAHYEVRFAARDIDAGALRARCAELLARETLDWEEQRPGSDRVRRYDLRATVVALALHERGDQAVLEMQLTQEEARTGRPTSVLAALGVDATPLEIVRTAIEADRPQVAMRAWRESGRSEQ